MRSTMGQATAGVVQRARDALDRHQWKEAFDLLRAEDAAGRLDGEGLRLLAKAAGWCTEYGVGLDALERSYAAFVAAGDRQGAAGVALMLRHQYVNGRHDAAGARGWVKRAERLLEGLEDTVEYGELLRCQGRSAFSDGRVEEGRRLLLQAVELGNRLGDANLVAMSLVWLGVVLCEIGQAEEAAGYLDEACAAAIGGELGPWATGFVYCNAISGYRTAGEFSHAGEWCDSATRWCQRASVTGFPGICRVHRAEFMRLRGAWTAAEEEARTAGEELRVFLPGYAGDAFYEIGEIRLRMGDLEAAEGLFQQARQLYREPQPGLAHLIWLRGDPRAALRSLESGLQSSSLGYLDRARLQALRVQLALAVGDQAVASGALAELERVTEGKSGIALRVLAVQARGELQLARGDAGSIATLREALGLWQEMQAPYEVGQVGLLLAQALADAGDQAGAQLELETARAAFERLGARLDLQRAPTLLTRRHTAAESQRCCFLVSDVVGSTPLVEAIGDEAWTALVAWHDSALRAAFGRHGGEEIDHAGDGFLVSFADPKAALDCAIDIQRSLAEHRRQHGFAPRVRIGVHATHAHRQGAAYRGRGVHEAARIGALAEGEQILASRASVPEGVPTSGARSVHLKGVRQPVEVVAVDWR